MIETEKLKFLVPYLGSLLILCGFIKLHLYYTYFNLSIAEYIEFSEILTIFLPDIVKYSFLVLLTAIFVFIAKPHEQDVQTYTIKSDTFFKRLLNVLKRFWFLVVMSAALVVAFLVSQSFFYKNIVVVLTIPCLLIFFIILFEFKHKYFLVYERELSSTYNNLLIMFFIFFSYVFQSSIINIRKVIDNKTEKICFNYKNNVIESSKDFIYLGKTKNYLFMFDNINEETSAYERSEIRKEVTHKSH